MLCNQGTELHIIVNAAKTDEGREYVENAIKGLVQGLQERMNLDLRYLDSIVIPSNFELEITEFQRSKNMCEGCTNDGLVLAVGKCLTFYEGEEKKVFVFLHLSLIQLLIDNPDKPEWIVPVIMLGHEMAHISDFYWKDIMLGRDAFDKNKITTPSHRLNYCANEIWEDYYASRISIETFTFSDDGGPFRDFILLKELKVMTEKNTSEAKEAIAKYRFSHDIDALFLRIQELSLELMKMSGRVIGHLHGLHSTTLVNGSKECIGKTLLGPIWEDLGRDLDNLFTHYPNWAGIQDYQPIVHDIVKCWNCLGIFLNIEEIDSANGFRIDVPWK